MKICTEQESFYEPGGIATMIHRCVALLYFDIATKRSSGFANADSKFQSIAACFRYHILLFTKNDLIPSLSLKHQKHIYANCFKEGCQWLGYV
jgi:hypothetical protein